MPMDSQGKYQMNNQKVRHSNAMHQQASPEAKHSVHSTTYDHGDGTGHTEMADGTRHEHPDMESTKDAMANAMDDCGGQGNDGKPMPGKPMMAKKSGDDDNWDM